MTFYDSDDNDAYTSFTHIFASTTKNIIQDEDMYGSRSRLSIATSIASISRNNKATL